MKRTIGLVAILGLMAFPSTAGAGKGCRPSTAWFPEVEGPLTRVSDRATEKNPVEVSFTHDPGVGALIARDMADLKYFPIQVLTQKRHVGLHVRIEWPTPAVDEIDLWLQSNGGEYLAGADGTNLPLPVDDDTYPQGAGVSAMGSEYIPGYATGNCAGFVVQSEALRTAGQDMTLKLWLGKATL